ncbi:glycosyltransferase family 39 protein [Patescibacteria group bacterium]|nr:glycosyltransferase family 39 protein [Patescibacteria group bacterium]
MKKLTPLFAIILISIMMIVSIISLKQESAIMDEVAHTPAGYSYLTQKDMRLNPEHPPLLKDLSAIPLLFMNDINFPDKLESWTTEVNGQWDFGFNFLYNSGNNADKIIFWSRIPMLLLLIAMGLILYFWTKELYGKLPALLAVFLFSFSPTFIAHGRYVTTDVGAAFGFFAAIYFFVKWIQKPTTKNLIWAGIFFGIAQAIKFSLILLIPYFGLLTLIWIFVKFKEKKQDLPRLLILYISRVIIIIIIGFILIYPIYSFHTANYPVEKQISDTQYITSKFPEPFQNLLVSMAKTPILKPYAQYTLGLFMVFQRAVGGNTTFFLGDVTNKGWHHYFPITYILKTPLALQLLTIICLIFIAFQIKRKKPKTFKWLNKYFPEFAMLLFLAVYWASSITSNLNIGVRHILPTFPFVYILLAGQIKRIYEYIKKKKSFKIYATTFVVLLVWYAVSSLSIFPYYLTYFTELVGGAKNGHIYVTDSNLDWGQDLKRLAKWTEENNIDKIHLDYFGGGDSKYYLGDKYMPWWDTRNPEDAKGSYIAISATFLKQGMAIPTKGWTKSTTYYEWLITYEPVAVIGNSIFVYYIPE